MQLINKYLLIVCKFHALDEYINTLSNKSPVSAGFFAETSKNISKNGENNLKRGFLTYIESKVHLPC